MSETLIRGADILLTMDDDRRELAGADLLLRDGAVAEIGQHEGLMAKGGLYARLASEQASSDRRRQLEASLAEGPGQPGEGGAP